MTINMAVAGTAVLSSLVALPFGCEPKVEAFFDSANIKAVGPVTGTYLVGGPFYLLFGWWGPGNISTEELRRNTAAVNGRLQFLHHYRIHGKDLKGVDLSGLDFWGCDFHGIDFSGANLSHAKLFRCDLSGTIFKNANLTNADLRRAYLVGADLRGADLSGADLSVPGDNPLSPTSLEDVKLEGANLSKTNLQRVKGLSQDELHRAKNWQSTRLY